MRIERLPKVFFFNLLFCSYNEPFVFEPLNRSQPLATPAILRTFFSRWQHCLGTINFCQWQHFLCWIRRTHAVPITSFTELELRNRSMLLRLHYFAHDWLQTPFVLLGWRFSFPVYRQGKVNIFSSRISYYRNWTKREH